MNSVTAAVADPGQAPERSRERILAAAVEIAAESGYEATTISEVTKRSGSSRQLGVLVLQGQRRTPGRGRPAQLRTPDRVRRILTVTTIELACWNATATL